MKKTKVHKPFTVQEMHAQLQQITKFNIVGDHSTDIVIYVYM